MFNNTVVDLHQLPAVAVIPPLGPERSQEIGVGPTSTRVTYYNTLGYPVTIIDRHGMRFNIPYNGNATGKRCLTIRLETTVNQDQWSNLDLLFTGIPEDKYAVLQKFRESWTAQRRTNVRAVVGSRAKVITLDFEIPVETFFEHSSVYHRGHDVVISRLDIQSAPPHPYHPDAAGPVGRFDVAGDKDPTANITLQMELIQGEETLAPRYLAISGKVFLVRPKHDNRRDPGLYLTHLERDPLNPDRTRSVTERYSLEEMETVLNMYRTQEEALAAGDLKTARKERVLELEHQLAQTKLQAENERIARETERADQETRVRQIEHDNRIEQLRAERETSMLKAENRNLQESLERERALNKEIQDRRDAERAVRATEFKERMEHNAYVRKDWFEDRSHERKDRYDETSTKRKDASDWMKFLPVIIVGIGAAAAALVKLFTS